MLRPHRSLMLAALSLASGMASATLVQRCIDESGGTLFTTLGCPEGSDMHEHQAFNASPGSVVPLLPRQETARRDHADELVVVGQRDDGCGNRLVGERLRKARMEGLTPPGMTRRDVDSLLGKPDRIVRRNGEIRYVYREKKGRSSQVTFDEHGCVKGSP